MAVMTANRLVATQRTFRALFFQGFEEFGQNHYSEVAMEMESTTEAENYNWLGALPEVRKWIGPRVVQGLRGFDYRLVNEEWELTLGIPRTKFTDEQLGQYPVRIMRMGQKMAAHPNKYLTEIRVAGTTNPCYDGKMFYATDHEEGKSGVQSNLLNGSGTNFQQVTDDFQKARAALRKFKNDQGQPFMEALGMDIPVLITCPPDMEGVFRRLLRSQMVGTNVGANDAAAASEDNTWVGQFQLRLDPRLTDENDWYMDFMGDMVKPFIKQNREPVEFYALQSPADETVRKFNEYEFGCYMRYTMGYGLWQFSIKVTN